MRVLIYKRNHTGDPDSFGTFGCEDCMGRVRDYKYDAVIGVGVKAPWKGHEEIADRITWVGIKPYRIGIYKRRKAGVYRFRKYKVFDGTGKILTAFAPALASYISSRRPRYFFSDNLNDSIQREIKKILELAEQ